MKSIHIHISSMAAASGKPILWDECTMIIIAYFFLLHPEKYTGYKYDSTPFYLEDVEFS